MTPDPVRRADGFTLLELLLAVSLGTLLAGFSVVGMQETLLEIRANAAARQIRTQLLTAREQALTERRAVEVQFIEPNEIRLVRIGLDGTQQQLNHVTLEGGGRFMLVPEVPDTPEAWGNATAIEFDNADRTLFLSDGTFADAAGAPLSGTVFLGIPGRVTSARAVTIFGATGRVTAFRWTGSVWER